MDSRPHMFQDLVIPEVILKKANNKFSKRWKKLEKLAEKEKLDLNKLSLKKYDLLWNKVKK